MVEGREGETANRGHAVRTKHRSATVFDTTTRSMLEARWAIFFRELNLKWKYEPTVLRAGRATYTPDFHVEGFGYVEIKPTLPLFISETSGRIRKIAEANPDLKIYAFCASFVAIQDVALYRGNTIFAPTFHQIYKLLSEAREDGDRLTDYQQSADIRRAMMIANTTRLNEWSSTKEIVSDVIGSLIAHEESARFKEQFK